LCIAYLLYEHIQDAQRHFIDAELSSMLSKSYIDDESSDQQVRQTALVNQKLFLTKATRKALKSVQQ
jgi:hypothetical protein